MRDLPSQSVRRQGGPVSIAAACLFKCYVQAPCNEDHNVNKHTFPTEYTPGDQAESHTPEVAEYPNPAYLPTETQPNYDPSSLEAMYTLAKMESRYITDSCRTQMPIAAKTTGSEISATARTSVVFTLAAAQCRREMRYEAERVGNWPIMPEPKDTYTDGAITGTKLKHWVIGDSPSLSVDGLKRIFRLQAYYLYALDRPPRKDEPINMGVLPYTSFSQEDNALTQESVYQERMSP